MNLEPTPEQGEVAKSARRFFEAETPASSAGIPDGHVLPPTWSATAQLGWLGIGVPEHGGGGGGSLPEQALLFREIGRGLAPGPWLGTVLAVQVARRAARDEIAADLMAGKATARLAEPWRYPASSIRRDSVSGRFRVTEFPLAEWVAFLVPGGAALVRRAEANAGASARTLEGPDPAIPVELTIVGGAQPEAVVIGPDAYDIVTQGRILAAAMLVGILEATRDASVSYAKQREQFGKPIGVFQAVKHRCADMAVRAEAAGSLLWVACLSAAAARRDAQVLAAGLKALASEYAVQSAHDNVQNHGGIGFTAECPAHRFVKRALALSVTLGSPEELHAEVARS
ncbi:MAG: acyl-CoA dehydrogenase family protein [Acidimicrobiales bacterium]